MDYDVPAIVGHCVDLVEFEYSTLGGLEFVAHLLEHPNPLECIVSVGDLRVFTDNSGLLDDVSYRELTVLHDLEGGGVPLDHSESPTSDSRLVDYVVVCGREPCGAHLGCLAENIHGSFLAKLE
ncbi:hypothetical protein ES703_100949 [subsurface metagenome]